VQNCCTTVRCCNVSTGQPRTNDSSLIHSKPVNKNNGTQKPIQHPMMHPLMIVWFETFHNEVTLLSVEKTKHKELTGFTNTDPRGHDILNQTHHLTHQRMPVYSTVECSVNAISVFVRLCVVHIGTGFIFSACECLQCFVINVRLLILCSVSLSVLLLTEPAILQLAPFWFSIYVHKPLSKGGTETG
jgi:hypothetical protein